MRKLMIVILAVLAILMMTMPAYADGGTALLRLTWCRLPPDLASPSPQV